MPQPRDFLLYSLYTKGRILGHKRGKRNSRPNQSLVAIEGVDSKETARSYLGKVGRERNWARSEEERGSIGGGERMPELETERWGMDRRLLQGTH